MFYRKYAFTFIKLLHFKAVVLKCFQQFRTEKFETSDIKLILDYWKISEKLLYFEVIIYFLHWEKRSAVFYRRFFFAVRLMFLVWESNEMPQRKNVTIFQTKRAFTLIKQIYLGTNGSHKCVYIAWPFTLPVLRLGTQCAHGVKKLVCCFKVLGNTTLTFVGNIFINTVNVYMNQKYEITHEKFEPVKMTSRLTWNAFFIHKK